MKRKIFRGHCYEFFENDNQNHLIQNISIEKKGIHTKYVIKDLKTLNINQITRLLNEYQNHVSYYDSNLMQRFLELLEKSITH